MPIKNSSVKAVPETKSELQALQSQANRVTDESLESTRRMLALCEKSKQCGIRTLVDLDGQGEQLDRVESDMYGINANMKEAEKDLKQMESFWAKKSKHSKEDARFWKASEDGKTVSGGQPTRVVDDRNNGSGPMAKQYITKITNDAREDEMDDNMAQVSTMIGGLRNMAIDISLTLDGQNQQLVHINQEAESNNAQIQGANQTARKLLK